MSFLTDEQLSEIFAEVFPSEGLTPDPKRLQACSYELKLGAEVYISGEKRLIRLSGQKPHVKIKPGDLAILLTKEKIYMPENYIGFISIKTTFKDMGLINISGFHVDPGFKGHLTFSVYNAGPNDIILRYAVPIFLIFLSMLHQGKKVIKPYDGSHNNQNQIPTRKMNKLTGKSVSPLSLDSRLSRVETNYKIQWGLLISAVGGLLLVFIKYLIGNN